jgi:hypothetical protein
VGEAEPVCFRVAKVNFRFVGEEQSRIVCLTTTG